MPDRTGEASCVEGMHTRKMAGESVQDGRARICVREGRAGICVREGRAGMCTSKTGGYICTRRAGGCMCTRRAGRYVVKEGRECVREGAAGGLVK